MRPPTRRFRRRWTVVATFLAATLVAATLVVDSTNDDAPVADSSEVAVAPAPTAASGSSSEDADSHAARVTTPGDDDQRARRRPSEPVLPERMPAADALNLLDDDELAQSAALVDRSPAEYRELVTRDSSYWMDRYGATYVIDPAPELSEHAASPNKRGAARLEAPASAPELSEGEVLSLHSNPDSSLKLFIDVDGGNVPGDWRDVVDTSTYPAWNPAGDGPALNAGERAVLHEIWSAVAADYEPFDIDVTTEDPGRSTLRRITPLDTTYGVTIALTDPVGLDCGGCAGIARLDTFADIEWPLFALPAGYRLGWTFSAELGHDIDAVAQTISHEAGHTLGLHHDGHLSEDYYFGHGHWNAIMGGANASRIHTQWSRGAYPGATEQEDDVAILADKLGFRRDEAGSTRDTAAPLVGGAATGVITSADDVDVFHLGSCEGAISLLATPTRAASNLDIDLALLDAEGVWESANPDNDVDTSGTNALGRPSWRMTGLDAEIETAVPAGDYWVQVRGGKYRTWASGGYDNYGSTGAYELTSSCGLPAPAPSTTMLAVTGEGAERTLTATVAREDGEAAVGVVRFTHNGVDIGQAEIVEGAATYVVTGLPDGLHEFAAEFIPADADAVTMSVSRPVAVAVGVTDLDITTEVDGRGLRVTVTVVPPDGVPFEAGGTLSIAIDGRRVSETTLDTARYDDIISALAPGVHDVTITYVPTHGDPVTRVLDVTIPAESSTTTLTMTGKGTSRTLTAEVAAGSEPVTGTITFVDSVFPTRGPARVTSSDPISLEDGKAVLPLTSLDDGVHRFEARFAPADPTRVEPSRSDEVETDVVAAASVTMDHSLSGNIVDLTITVGPRRNGHLDLAVDGGATHTAVVTGERFSARLGPLPGGRHSVVVTYRPTKGEPVSRTLNISVPKLTAAMKVKAPKKVRKGKKAKLTVTVRRDGQPVAGKVRIKTKGWKRTVWLNSRGKAKVKSSKLTKGKKQKFVVRYLGDGYTKKSNKHTVIVKIRG